MRATITLIFIISEYAFITGGDGNCVAPPEVENGVKVTNVTETFRMQCKGGYVRKAGTSNLFRCANNKWINKPALTCICTVFQTTTSAITPSPISKKDNVTTTLEQSTAPTPGNIVSTTAHTSSTMFCETSKTTTTMEETSVTTSITTKITSSATTEKEMQNKVSSTFSPISALSTGVTATVIVLLIVGLAATVTVLLWRRRSRRQGFGVHSVGKTQTPGSDHPLICQNIMSNYPPDSIPPPDSQFADFPESTYPDASLSA